MKLSSLNLSAPNEDIKVTVFQASLTQLAGASYHLRAVTLPLLLVLVACLKRMLALMTLTSLVKMKMHLVKMHLDEDALGEDDDALEALLSLTLSTYHLSLTLSTYHV